MGGTALNVAVTDGQPSLYQLLDPEVPANPYPLYHRLRECDPVPWEPFLRCWVVTSYSSVLSVLHKLSASRTPCPSDWLSWA